MADVKPSAGAAAEGAARGDSGASKQHHDSAVAGSLGAATASRPGRDDRLTSLRAIRAAEHKRTSSLTRMQSVSGGRRAGAGGEGSVSGAKPVIPASGRLLFGGTSLRFIQTDEMDVGNVIKQLLDVRDCALSAHAPALTLATCLRMRRAVPGPQPRHCPGPGDGRVLLRLRD